MEIWNIEIPGFENKIPFLQKKGNKLIASVILGLLGLLYHTTMDRKGISVDAILSPPCI